MSSKTQNSASSKYGDPSTSGKTSGMSSRYSQNTDCTDSKRAESKKAAALLTADKFLGQSTAGGKISPHHFGLMSGRKMRGLLLCENMRSEAIGGIRGTAVIFGESRGLTGRPSLFTD